MSKSVYIDWGAFIMAIINFLITALVLFAMVKLINMVRGGFTGLTRDTKFLESLTPEEKATIKGRFATKKELRAIKAARDEAQAKQKQKQRRRQKLQNPKRRTICSVKSATFSKRNKLTRQLPFSTKQKQII